MKSYLTLGYDKNIYTVLIKSIIKRNWIVLIDYNTLTFDLNQLWLVLVFDPVFTQHRTTRVYDTEDGWNGVVSSIKI